MRTRRRKTLVCTMYVNLCGDEALRHAVDADCYAQILAIRHACDPTELVSASASATLTKFGFDGKTVGEILDAIGEHVRAKGTPVSRNWNTEGA